MGRMHFYLLRAASGACSLAGSFGFIEFRRRGVQVVIGGHPVDPFFVEVGCVFLIAFGILALMGLFWECISRWRWVSVITTSKTRKFRDLYEEICARRNELNEIVDTTVLSEASMLFISKIHELSVALKELGIPCPDRFPKIAKFNFDSASNEAWHYFLVRLAGDARIGNIKAARRVINDYAKVVSKTQSDNPT